MDLTMGWRPSIRWKIELFGVVVAIAIITVLVYASFTNFLRAYSIGDSTMDIQLPTWPAKLMVPWRSPSCGCACRCRSAATCA